MQRRVVVSGVRPVSSIGVGKETLGVGKETFWANAMNGRGYYRAVDFGDVDLEQYRSRICSPLDDFNLNDFFENPKRLMRTGRATQYSAAGAYLAFSDAGFILEPRISREKRVPDQVLLKGVDPLRCGVIMGQAVSNSETMRTGYPSVPRNHTSDILWGQRAASSQS